MRRWGLATPIVLGTICALPLQAQREEVPPMSIEDYAPRSTLVVPENPVDRARFPFVDVHLHLNALMPRSQLDQLILDMDQLNLTVGVNLSGGSGDLSLIHI